MDVAARGGQVRAFWGDVHCSRRLLQSPAVVREAAGSGQIGGWQSLKKRAAGAEEVGG